MKKRIYVDVDGTLLCSRLDDEFKKKCVEMERFEDVLSWYNEQYVNDLVMNMELVHELIELKKQGYELVLWTNRGECQVDMTRENLGDVWNMFDSHEFHSGQKGKCVLDGVVYDNEEKYLECGVEGKLFNFKAA